MSLVTLSNVEKSFGRRVLLDKASLTIYPNERIGLIGDNGSGKSTLFRLIVGEQTAEAGVVSVAKTVRVGYLTQDPVFDPNNTVIDEAELAFAHLHEMSHKLRDLEHEMAVKVDDELQKVLDAYQEVQHDFDLAGGYVWHHRLESTLLGVGLPQSMWEQPIGTLSGGQKSRVALAKLLISEPDVLLLDEPTNHLDLEAIEWLEKYLEEYRGSAVIISHDRFFLDRLSQRVVWLTRAKLKSYTGNYTNFVEQKELEELSQQRAYTEQQADIEKQKEFIRRFGAGQRSKEAKGREKRLNRLLISDQIVQAVSDTKKINLTLKTEQRAGDQLLRVQELSKAYENKPLWKDIGFNVVRGERIGIIGPNGSGKTTLLEVLLGAREPDSGVIKWGSNLTMGYYNQKLDEFNAENTVYDECLGKREANDKQLRDVLAVMLFGKDDVEKKVGALSGGERARLRFAQLLLDKPNVLILDEPTNHLDIASSEALERALADFPGTILCVSHDRYFLNQVAERLLVLHPPGMIDFEGNYSEWVLKAKQLTAKADAARNPGKAESKPKPEKKQEAKPTQQQHSGSSSKKKDNPYARSFGKLTVKELEHEISMAEQAIEQAQAKIADPANFRDQQKLKKLQAEYDTHQAKKEQLEAEYYARET